MDGAALVPARLGDQAALDETGDDGVGGDASDPGDVGTAARPEVGDHRKGLERRGREAALYGAVEEPRARVRRLARGAEGVAACDVLEDDAAAALRVVVAEQLECGLHPLRAVVRRGRQIVDREGLRGDDQQRLQRPGEGLVRPKIAFRRAAGFAGGACRRRRD